MKPATTQFELLWDLKKTFSPELTICLLSYSLAPEAQYPVQLQQAIGLFKYLLEDKGKKPENVRIDSKFHLSCRTYPVSIRLFLVETPQAVVWLWHCFLILSILDPPSSLLNSPHLYLVPL